MSIRIALRLSLLSVLLILLLSCAGQVPPGGGPPDTEPPKIISTSPAPYTTSFRGTGIVLEFDEYVDRSSLEQSIFISPSVGGLSFDWSGTEVEIRFGEALRENTTYVVTVGTDVVDTRNKNRMSQAFSLAFSTGGQIDRGAIEGRVYPVLPSDSPEGVMVFAFKLDGLKSDTLNPRTLRPDYVTQTGSGGKFFLYHLVLGAYRVYAFRDQYRNFLYDPETDEYATAPVDVRLTVSDTLIDGLSLQLAKEDTTEPRLIKVSALSNRFLVAEFSEAIDTNSIQPDQFRLSDTAGVQQIDIRTIAPRLPKRTEVFLVTEPESQGSTYELKVVGIRDDAGLGVSTLANAAQFSASAFQDTVRPGVAELSISDSARDVPLRPELIAFFTEPLEAVDPTNIVALQDSAGLSVTSRIRWAGSAAVILQPTRDLVKKAWYRFSVLISKLVDAAGNRGRDTTIMLRFETIDSERFSSVEGIIRDSNPADTGQILIQAVDASRRAGGGAVVTIAKPGPFAIADIVEGRYTIRAFLDKNKNGIFDAGKVFPFVASERFSVYRDTVRVRARWPVEGVILELN